MVEKEKGMQIKVLRFDGGVEYFSDEFIAYLKEQEIQRKYSCRESKEKGYDREGKGHVDKSVEI